MTGGRLSLAGRELAYETVGEGPPLVLVHAFPFDRRMWRGTAAALAVGRRVVLPDLRGFGESTLGTRGFTLADMADDVLQLLDHLGADRAAVAGLSMGGYVALAFAARHPERLRALVLADTRAGADSAEGRRAREEAIGLVRAQGVAALVAQQLPKLLGPHASDTLRGEVRALGTAQPAEAVIAALEAMRDRPDRGPDLAAIAVPTLVLVGSEDRVTPPSEAAALAQAIPQARLVTIPGVGHLANLEAPEAFADALAVFLT